MIISSFIVIILLTYAGMRFSSLWSLSRYYISPPLAGGILGIIVLVTLMAVTGVDWKPEPIVGRLFVTCFLFFIGVKMGSIYTYKYIRILEVFFLLTTGFLVLLELLTWLLLREQTNLLAIVGAMSFAWNDEWLMYMQGIHPDVSIIFYTSMLLVFLFTPLMLRLMSKPDIPQNRRITSIGIPWIWRLSGFVLASVISVLAYMIKQYGLEQIPFLFDLVISLADGHG
ncbi:MAG: hypothetical protein WD424_09175 [Paenibacillaceae bacterium]